jgi:hypothetical protein
MKPRTINAIRTTVPPTIIPRVHNGNPDESLASMTAYLVIVYKYTRYDKYQTLENNSFTGNKFYIGLVNTEWC